MAILASLTLGREPVGANVDIGLSELNEKFLFVIGYRGENCKVKRGLFGKYLVPKSKNIK